MDQDDVALLPSAQAFRGSATGSSCIRNGWVDLDPNQRASTAASLSILLSPSVPPSHAPLYIHQSNHHLEHVVVPFSLTRGAYTHRSIIEDYAVLYFGSAMFKICRLLLIAMSSVHIFACAFHRVKKESAASPDDVAAFYASKGVDPEVRAGLYPSSSLLAGRL